MDGHWYWAEYSTFIVDSEANKYKLTVGGYSGDAGDAMRSLNNMKFTTFDNDNDLRIANNCAAKLGGGGWYKMCGKAQFNGARGIKMSFCDGFCWWLPYPTDDDKALQTSRLWLMCPTP